MNILQNLIELYNHLSPDSTYRDVIRLILLHLQEASEATIYDLAELTNSSRTTIRRLLDKLGYSGYTEFHHALRQAVRNYTYYNRMMNKTVRVEEIPETLLSEVMLASQQESHDLTVEALQQMAAVLKTKRQVLFYQINSTGVFTLQQNLAMAGIETQNVMMLQELLQSILLLERESLIFCRTIEYAETQDQTPVFEALKEKGTEIVMLGGAETRYANYVDRYILDDIQHKSIGIVSSLILSETYFFALNEVFRRLYIDK